MIIDLDLRVRMITQYPCTVGHNYYEVRRTSVCFLAHRFGVPIQTPALHEVRSGSVDLDIVHQEIVEMELDCYRYSLERKRDASLDDTDPRESPLSDADRPTSWDCNTGFKGNRRAAAGDLQPSGYASELERRGGCPRGCKSEFIRLPPSNCCRKYR